MSTRHIDTRIKHHLMDKPTNALDRSRKYKSLTVTKTKLVSWRKSCQIEMKQAAADMADADKRLIDIEIQMAKLKEETGGDPIVTEHALLRYVERRMGVDLDKCLQEIIKLPKKDVVMMGQTIITVYPDNDDHFNLAQNESK